MPIERYTRTAKHIIDAVVRQFGDEAQIQIGTPDIIRWINQGQRDIVQTNTTINESAVSAPIVQDQETYPINTDPIFKDVLNIHTVMVNSVPLKNVTFQEALTYIINGGTLQGESGTSTIWYIKAGLLHLWPIPNKSIASGLKIYFTKAPTEVTVQSDFLSVPDNFYNSLLQYVMQQAYELDENFQAASAKNAQYKESLGLQQNQTLPQQEFFPMIMTDPEDYM